MICYQFILTSHKLNIGQSAKYLKRIFEFSCVTAVLHTFIQHLFLNMYNFTRIWVYLTPPPPLSVTCLCLLHLCNKILTLISLHYITFYIAHKLKKTTELKTIDSKSFRFDPQYLMILLGISLY